MCLAAALAFGLSLGAAVASAEDTPGASGGTLSVATWGGAYEQSQEIAYFEPFAKETGTSIATQIYDGSLAKIKAMIGGDSSPVDVVDLSSSALGALCSDG
ncbi:MAG: ABC transporter substrate-binding protein, partial [Methyloceanibacter sp.]